MYTMHMSKKPDRYQINEKDINTVLKILKRIDPKNATSEMAITILEHFQTKFHILAHEDPNKLVELFDQLKEEKRLKTN